MKEFWIAILFLLIQLQIYATTDQRLNLAPNASFENERVDAWFPVGLTKDFDSALRNSENHAHHGNKSLKILVCPEKIESGTEYYSSYNAGEGKRIRYNELGVHGVRTIAYRLDRDIKSFQASVWVLTDNADDISLEIRWYNRFGRRRPVELIHTSSSYKIIDDDSSWLRFQIEGVKPHNAHQAQLAVISKGEQAFYIDDVHIDLTREEGSQILINQVGYESNSNTKFALFQISNLNQDPPNEFQVLSLDTQQIVHQGTWKFLDYHPTFDRIYWQADFNIIETAGRYVIQTTIGNNLHYSYPFRISESLIMSHVAKPAYEFFYYQRCGMEIPGFHGACHLDDSTLPDGTQRYITGGWHDAGDYNKYNGYTPESFFALILAYDRKKDFFDQYDRDNDGISDLLDEANWGAKFMLKCIDNKTMNLIGQISTGYRYWGKPEDETDNVPNTGDERPVNNWNGNPTHLSAAFALLSKYIPDQEEYRDVAINLYEKHGGSITDLLALYSTTHEETYKQEAIDLADTLLKSDDAGLSNFQQLAEFALSFPKHDFVSKIKEIAPVRLEQLQKKCDLFFGIHRRKNLNGEWIYFRDYQHINDWYVGESREYLDLAYEGLLIDKLGYSEGRILSENQLHWILGRNPFNVSLMEGAGSSFIPQYHHRYNMLPASQNGAVLGAVINGITRSWPWTDRPWLDLNPMPTGEYQSNEPWLPHNNRMLYVLSLW